LQEGSASEQHPQALALLLVTRDESSSIGFDGDIFPVFLSLLGIASAL
jgi:hypothetical protein